MTAAPPETWAPPPAERALAAGEVHVWRLALAQPAAQLARLAATLTADERARAARFHFARDRDAFTAVRGALRTLAGEYLGHPPDALVLGYRARGKPFLEAPAADLRFNVSHSGDHGLLAFTRGRELGVDVERRRPIAELAALAQLSFSAHEYAAWSGLAAHDQIEAFFACWARKEAFIKTTGEGVSQLADFDVSLAPGEPARLLRVKDAPAQRWSMHALPAIPDHAAALVVEGGVARLCCWDWPPAG